MNIDDVHNRVLLIENKERVAFNTPAEIDIALHWGQMDVFRKYAPLYGKDETAKKACDPFKVKFVMTGANSIGGSVTLPSTTDDATAPDPLAFGHLLSGSAVSYNNTINPATGLPYGPTYWPIEFVNDDERDERLMSQLCPVTADRPIASTDGAGVIQLYPQVPNAGYFTYLAIPMPPQWVALSQTARTLVYDPVNSVQLQWNEDFLTAIISKALVYLGINLDSDKLIQYMAQNQ